MSYLEKIEEAAHAVSLRSSLIPRVALVLGSGLGRVADAMEDAERIPYAEIPHWPSSAVVGHAGRLLMGTLAGVPTALCQGRVHLYEGWTARETAFPIRVLRRLGARSLVVTNAAGSLHADWPAPTLMLIRDHLNLTGDNPLVGPHHERLGERFPDMSEAYASRYREAARASASDLGIRLEEGVYVALRGPSYETPAEVRMLAGLGGDAVGMSTVPEVIAAVHGGMQVLGISCLTNPAAGLVSGSLDHEEVLEAGQAAAEDLSRLILRTVPALD